MRRLAFLVAGFGLAAAGVFFAACSSKSGDAEPHVSAPSGDDAAVPDAAVPDAAVPDAGTTMTNLLAPDVVLFDSDRGGNYEIYRMDADGSNPTAITQDSSYDSWWGRASPDRSKILFYRRAAGTAEDYTKAELWVMSADGTSPTKLRAVGTDGWLIQGHAEWSPDGNAMVMCGTVGTTTAVFVTDVQGRNPRVVASTGGWNCDPSWSPDGDSIVFNHCDTPNCPKTDYQIALVPADGGAPTMLTKNAFENYDPYFSHDGSQIAWLVKTSEKANSVEDGGLVLGAWSIAAMAPDGGDTHAIIDDGQVNSKPGWSRDDQTIFFHRMEPTVNLTFQLFAIQPDGGGLTKLTNGPPGNNEYPTN